MDQLFQLQRQIQDLKQEINNITQVANQLQRAEANNAAQLQRLQQNEALSTQQLQNIQQMCNRINQEVNVINNMAQQVTSQMANRPFTSGQYGTSTGSQFGTGQFGNIGTIATAGLTNPNQISSYGNTQIAPSQFSSLASYWGQGLSPQDMSVSSQFLSNRQYIPQSYGTTSYVTGINQNIPYQYGTYQYGTTGSAMSQYIPNYSTSMSMPGQQSTGMVGTQSANMPGTQYIGSSF